MRSWMALIVFAACASPAGAPAGFEIWTGAQLKGFTKNLAPKINAQKVAIQQLGKWGNHLLMVAHREGPGEAELHEKQADIFIVQSGEATLKVGGTVVSPKNTAANEVRGASINGGEDKKIGAGDVVHIPAKIPHQVLVDAGKQVTYAVVKVDE